jgi:uncharacterized membrane protein
MRTLPLAATLAAPALAAAQATFLPLGPEANVRHVSWDGRATFGLASTAAGSAPAMWDCHTGAMTPLAPAPNASLTFAWNISRDNRTIIGGAQITSKWGSPIVRPVAWKDGIPTILPAPYETSNDIDTRAVSADGSCIAGFIFTGSLFPHDCLAVIWCDGIPAIIPPLDGDQYTVIQSVSADGRYYAGYSRPAESRCRAVRWEHNAPPLLLFPDDWFSMALAMTPDARTIVGLAAAPNEFPRLFRWTNGHAELLDTAGALPSITSISDDGSVIAYLAWTKQNVAIPSFWSPAAGHRPILEVLAQHGAIPDPQNWELDFPFISGTGRTFAGWGRHLVNGQWRHESWTATLPTDQICYANCDASSAPPTLNIADFACFLNRLAAADPYANCDRSTTPPTINIQDFSCFLNTFAAGCD